MTKHNLNLKLRMLNKLNSINLKSNRQTKNHRKKQRLTLFPRTQNLRQIIKSNKLLKKRVKLNANLLPFKRNLSMIARLRLNNLMIGFQQKI